MNGIRKEDIVDAEIIDAEELASSGSTAYLSGVTVVSTTGSSQNVRTSGYYLQNDPDDSVEGGDVAVIQGSTAADGTYTVSTVIDDDNFTVLESIADSTGGTVYFKHSPGARRVGIDAAVIPNVSSSNVQDALAELGALSGSGGGFTANEHETIRQLIHFVDLSPGRGFGDYEKETDYSGPFETEVRLYDAGVLLFKKTIGITGSGTPIAPSPIEYRLYDTDGTTVLQKIVETITYNGIFESVRSGTVS